MTAAMGDRKNNAAVAMAVTLFLGIPVVVLFLVKDAHHLVQIKARGGGGAFLKDPQAAAAPRPEDILLDQLRRMENPKQDKRAIMLHVSIGKIYEEAGLFSEAVEQFQAARALAMQHGEQLGVVQGALGASLYQQGKLKKAKRELESGMVIVEPRTAAAFDIQKNLASVRRDEGKLDDALELFLQIYRDRALHEAVTSEAWAELNNELGETYNRKGEADKALMYFHKAWELLQPGVEPDIVISVRREKELAICENHIGNALHDEGQVANALAKYRTALKIQRKALRPGHPHMAGTMMNIGRAQRDLGEPESAMATLAEAERTLAQAGKGREHWTVTPEYGGLLSLRADLLREQEKLDEAEAAAKEALAVQTAAFEGDENPDLAVTLNGLGSVFHDQKKYQEAMNQYLRALDINLKTVGPRNPETAASYNNLGNIFQDLGDDERAKKYYQKCLEIQLVTVGEKSPELSVTYNNIGTILFRQQKGDLALPYFEKAVQIATAAGVPAKSPDRTIYEENLVMAQEEVAKKRDDSAVSETGPSEEVAEKDATTTSDHEEEGRVTLGEDGDEFALEES